MFSIKAQFLQHQQAARNTVADSKWVVLMLLPSTSSRSSDYVVGIWRFWVGRAEAKKSMSN